MNEDLWHELLSSIKEVIKDMQSDMKDIKESQTRTEKDVAYHILRTNLLEEGQKKQNQIVDQLQKDNWKLKGAFALIGLVLTILSVVALFKHP